MAKNYIQEGDTLNLTAPYAVASGGGLLVGALFAVALVTLANGASGSCATEGVFELAKNSAEAWTQGQKIYWDNTNKVCTATATSNTLIGVATEPAANPSSVGRVKLNQSVV
jgi:predicted RecA/RadA family phage recombinase